MGINLSNFLSSKLKNKRMMEFQDLDHIDGVSISTVSANLYESSRDDLVMFYFRDGANFASVYTQSKIISENIKWNINQKPKKIFSLIVNTRNANCFTGKQGYKSLEKIAELTSQKLTEKQKEDEDHPKKIKSREIIFGCTGTIGENFPEDKIKSKIPELVNKIRYTQNKLIWMKLDEKYARCNGTSMLCSKYKKNNPAVSPNNRTSRSINKHNIKSNVVVYKQNIYRV